MAELIKKVKIKKQDGTFTDYIPIGADAANIKTTSGESVQTILDRIQQKGISVYDNINSIADDINVNEIFMLRNYDTLFTVVSSPTISSLQIGNNRYADIISKRVVIDSLGIATIIDPTLFSEIVSYAFSEGIELVFAKKTYTLNETITINASGLNLSGLSEDSNINYTGNNYAFIINKMENCTLSNFRIRCNGSNSGIYFKHTSGSNNIVSSTLHKIKIDNAVNAIKADCYMKHINFEDCAFTISGSNGTNIDFSEALYPDFITINNCLIKSNGSINNGIHINNGTMINITNNEIIGFKYGFYMVATNNTKDVNNINILQNNFKDISDTAFYVNGNNSSVYIVNNLIIRDCLVQSTTLTIDYGIFISNVHNLILDNINIEQDSTHQIWLSNCVDGRVGMINCWYDSVTQANNQINGTNIKYEYINYQKKYTVPANGNVNVQLGSTHNLINFDNYIINQVGPDNSTNNLTVSNYSNTSGKITFTLANSSNAAINVLIQAF